MAVAPSIKDGFFQSSLSCSLSIFAGSVSEYPRPEGRGRRKAPGEGPQRLAPVFGARHQNFEAQRGKNALRVKVPHPSLSHPGEGVKARAKGELHRSMRKSTISNKGRGS